MKVKHISILLAAALALAACSKSEIQYESPSDICFAPASKNITKAAMPAGVLDKNVKLGVWAYWNGVNGTVESTATYANYTDAYLDNSLFTNRAGTDNWGGYDSESGKEVAYPWPSSGALVFAGYTKPSSNTNLEARYILSKTIDGVLHVDELTFANYAQDVREEVLTSDDLCWFSATTESYNYRTAASGAVSVTLNHALTWITFKAGSGAPVISGKEWVITEIKLNGIRTVGNATCKGQVVTWESWSPSNINVYSSATGYKLGELPTGDATLPAIENVKNNTLVIPQEPVMAEITYKTSPTSDPVKKTINLTLDNTKDQNGNANTKITKWEAGKHYTYTLHFKSNEIRVTPSYGEWTSTDQSITVE